MKWQHLNVVSVVTKKRQDVSPKSAQSVGKRRPLRKKMPNQGLVCVIR